MCVCVCVCMCKCICLWTNVCMCLYMNACMGVYECVYMNVCICVYECVYMNVCMCNACMFVCLSMFVYSLLCQDAWCEGVGWCKSKLLVCDWWIELLQETLVLGDCLGGFWVPGEPFMYLMPIAGPGGLGVWFIFRVDEVPGSIPGQDLLFYSSRLFYTRISQSKIHLQSSIEFFTIPPPSLPPLLISCYSASNSKYRFLFQFNFKNRLSIRSILHFTTASIISSDTCHPSNLFLVSYIY